MVSRYFYDDNVTVDANAQRFAAKVSHFLLRAERQEINKSKYYLYVGMENTSLSLSLSLSLTPFSITLPSLSSISPYGSGAFGSG